MLGLVPLEAPVTPVEALRRIAVLLERSGAGSYRIEAFRRAMDTVRTAGPEEIAERAAAGSLKELPGVGDSSASVIAQAVAGDLPDYLISLQDKAREPLAAGGEAIYAALQGDLHSHSTWSDGGSPIDENVLTAAELGQSWLAVTDHSPRLRVANGLSAARLTEQLRLIDSMNNGLGERFRLLRGIEVDILDDGGLDQSPEMLARLDVVTASVHSKLKMAAEPMTRRMVAAVRNPRVNVLGHCTGRLVTGSRGTRAQSTFDAEQVFAACLESDVAVEINSRPERCDPPDDLLAMAVEMGCLFAIDSDAHAPGQLDMKRYGCERAQAHGIDPDRIVTTWSADRVLDWAAAKLA